MARRDFSGVNGPPPEMGAPQEEEQTVELFEEGNSDLSSAEPEQSTEGIQGAEGETEQVKGAEETQETTEPQTDDNEQVRYQYWQSQADKAKAKIAELEQQLEEMKPLTYLQEVLLNDPELLSIVNNRLSKSVKTQQQQAPMAAPVPPPDFDPLEMHDPNTPSGRYWQQMQEYQANLVEQKLSSLKDEILSRFDEIEQKQKKTLEQIKAEKIEEDFLRRHPEVTDFDRFKEWAKTASKELTVDDWYNFYKQKTGGGLGKKIAGTKKPLPSVTAVSAQSATEQLDENLDFNVGLLKIGTQRKY